MLPACSKNLQGIISLAPIETKIKHKAQFFNQFTFVSFICKLQKTIDQIDSRSASAAGWAGSSSFPRSAERSSGQLEFSQLWVTSFLSSKLEFSKYLGNFQLEFSQLWITFFRKLELSQLWVTS
jgi:hypothetical protein